MIMLDAVIVVIVTIACVFDLRTRRIPNVLTFGAAGAGFVFAGVMNGLGGLGMSLAGWSIAVALFLPFFLLRGMGAGDVKLLGAIGAWLGPAGAVATAFFTAIAGGVLALVVVLARGYLAESMRNLWAMLMHWRIFGLRPVPDLTLQSSRGPRLAYAVPIAAGALVTLWIR
jgi:prepilin peptidase CpaA